MWFSYTLVKIVHLNRKRENKILTFWPVLPRDLVPDWYVGRAAYESNKYINELTVWHGPSYQALLWACKMGSTSLGCWGWVKWHVGSLLTLTGLEKQDPTLESVFDQLGTLDPWSLTADNLYLLQGLWAFVSAVQNCLPPVLRAPVLSSWAKDTGSASTHGH